MKAIWGVIAVCAVSIGGYAYAADMGVYAFPQKGQTQEQQTQDESKCTQWAQQKTGLNPAVLQYKQQEAMAKQQQVTQEANKPEVGRNLGRAALTGAALGGINQGMDDGAGKGAVMGLTVGASKARANSIEQKKQGAVNAAQAQSQSVQAETETYLRAYCACMEGQGYSVR